MAQAPTYEDAKLIIRLYEMRREERMRKAREWFMQSFHARTAQEYAEFPQGSDTNANFRLVFSYWEMAASFVTAGILNEELFFQNCGEFLYVWEQVRELIPVWRESFRNPTTGQNMEKVAKRFREWMDRQQSGAYDAWSAAARPSIL